MVFSIKTMSKLREQSSRGYTVNVKVVNHLNQVFNIAGFIPDFYKLKNGRFPNFSVAREFMMLNFDIEEDTTLKLPLEKRLVIIEIKDRDGELIGINKDFEQEVKAITDIVKLNYKYVNKFALFNPNNKLAKQYVGKVAIYHGHKVPHLHNKKCLIVGLKIKKVEEQEKVDVYICRGADLIYKKVTVPLEEFEATFKLRDGITDDNDFIY